MKRNKSGFITVVIVSLYLLIPLFMTFLYSVFSKWSDILPEGFTFRYYLELFSDRSFGISVLRTVLISILPILLTAMVVLLAMYVILLYLPGLEKYIRILCTIPYAIQGVILAVSVLSLYSNAPGILSNRTLLLTGTYCVAILPYMYQGIQSSLLSVNAPRLIEAAEMLGAGRLYAFFRVVVPNILSGVIISAMLSASIIFGDFVIANTLGGNYFETAQIYLYQTLFASGQKTSAVIVVLFAITLVISLIAFSLRKKERRQE